MISLGKWNFLSTIRNLRKCSKATFSSSFKNNFASHIPASRSSLLVVSEKVFSPVKPLIDGIIFEDIEELEIMLKCRNHPIKNIDELRELKDNYEYWIQLNEIIGNLGEELAAANKRKYRISEYDPNYKEEMKNAIDKIHLVLQEIKRYQLEYYELVDNFAHPYLKLPNILRPRTGGEDTQLTVHMDKPKFDFIPKSHAVIGSLLNQLIFKDVSLNSHFFKGNLAKLEHDLGNFTVRFFQERKFNFLSNTDILRAVTIEGCGINEEKEVLQIEDLATTFNNYQFLCGSSSLPAFVSLFCRRIMNPNTKYPIKLLTLGKNYSFEHADSNNSLFHASQISNVSAFIAFPKTKDLTDNNLADILKTLDDFYKQFNIHFVKVKYGGPNLKRNECMALGIEMYSPVLEEYFEIARISAIDNYISKRLQCWEGRA